MDAHRLFQPAAPHQHLLLATPSETCDFAWSLQATAGQHAVVRIVRGSKARTAPDLFDEFAAALQFPYYFGENWDALDECLADLEWLVGDAYILFFTDTPQLLDRESAGQFALLLDLLEKTAHKWNQTEKRGSGSAPRPFHVVFQCSPEDEAALLARFQRHGRSLNRLK
jgi:RNAse (barnase) inhibitor barstar